MIKLIRNELKLLNYFLPSDDFFYYFAHSSEEQLIKDYYQKLRPLLSIIKTIPKLSELSKTSKKTNVYLRYFSFKRDWFVVGIEKIQNIYFAKVIICTSNKISRSAIVDLNSLTSFIYEGKDFFSMDYNFQPMTYHELQTSFLEKNICPRSVMGF